MNKLLIVALGAFSFISCAEPPASAEPTSAAVVAAPTPVSAVSDTPTNIISAQPGANPVVLNAPATQPVTQAASTAKGMNPAHGQPGHRCDIPVGAPLNSPAGAAPQPQVQQIQPTSTPTGPSSVGPQITPIQPAPSAQPAIVPAGGKGRINPAHGQPGHDCAKPVGAPLD